MFSNSQPIHVEFCSGNGEWILKAAEANPHINWIAVERKRARAAQIVNKQKQLLLKNLFVFWGLAEDFCKSYKRKISEIYINFPDPWPKRRHAKNRLIKEPFTREMADSSCEGAAAYIVTDDPSYRDQVIESMLWSERWKAAFDPPYYKHELENYGSSFFARLWEGKGKNIYYMKFYEKYCP